MVLTKEVNNVRSSTFISSQYISSSDKRDVGETKELRQLGNRATVTVVTADNDWERKTGTTETKESSEVPVGMIETTSPGRSLGTLEGEESQRGDG